MIRTIVVDDEPYLRNSIKLSIESANPEFTVIAEAGNGAQAYDLIAELRPDVVFLDIRMPVMDGISLLEKLYTNNINPIRVILSGYSEFEYAKKAIRYEVFDYVLKPIHVDQLSGLLSNIADRVSQKRSDKEYEYLHYILKGIKPADSPENLSQSMQRFSGYYCFYLTVGSYMYTKNNQFNPAGDNWSFENLVSKIKEICPDSYELWSASGENQNELLLIIGVSGEDSMTIGKLAVQIRQLIGRLSVPVTMVYTDSDTDPDDLRNTAVNLKYASMNSIIFGYSSSIPWTDTTGNDNEKTLLKENDIKSLQNLIRGKRYSDFKDSVKDILALCSKERIYQYQLRLELLRILEILHDDYLSSELTDFVNDSITNSLSYDDIEEIMLQYIDDYSRNYYSEESQGLADMIKEYINEHYESQLTLKEIAADFHISPSHLSNIFKKAFNESPNEYIMSKRIEKSKELLSVFPPISIKEIAILAGYTDPFYFSRIFKISTGMTPTEFRLNAGKSS